MGREILIKDFKSPAFPKENRYFLLAGPSRLTDIDFTYDFAGFLSDIETVDNLRLCFFGNIGSGSIGSEKEANFDQAVAVLFNVQERFSIPIAMNIGDPAIENKVAKISNITIIDDYLCLNRNFLETFLQYKKPVIIDKKYLSSNELMKVVSLAEKYKTPLSILTKSINQDELKLYKNFFVFLKTDSYNLNLIKAGIELGIRGFILDHIQSADDYNHIREILKAFHFSQK